MYLGRVWPAKGNCSQHPEMWEFLGWTGNGLKQHHHLLSGANPSGPRVRQPRAMPGDQRSPCRAASAQGHVWPQLAMGSSEGRRVDRGSREGCITALALSGPKSENTAWLGWGGFFCVRKTMAVTMVVLLTPLSLHKSTPAVSTAVLCKLCCKTLWLKIIFVGYYSPWEFHCFLKEEKWE